MEAIASEESKHGSTLGSPSTRAAEDAHVVKTFDHVLVPLDGSAFARAAVSTGRALAERFGAEFHTIGVSSTDPVAGIAARATELGSALVCLSSRPRSRVVGAFLDSAADVVLRGSDRALVAVGPLAERSGWIPAPRDWPTPLSADRIVACVDGTRESESALAEAASWARALHKSLTILTVIENTPDPAGPRPDLAHHRTRHGAAEYLDALVDQWQGPTLEVDGLVLRDAIGPASAIRDHLARRPAALVALVAPDRSGFHRIRRGATADKIIRASPAPCLLIPAGRRPVMGLPDANQRRIRATG